MQISSLIELLKSIPLRTIIISIVVAIASGYAIYIIAYNSYLKSMEELPDVKETITSEKKEYNNLIKPDSGNTKLPKQPNIYRNK
jgi:hypothetical protein